MTSGTSLATMDEASSNGRRRDDNDMGPPPKRIKVAQSELSAQPPQTQLEVQISDSSSLLSTAGEVVQQHEDINVSEFTSSTLSTSTPASITNSADASASAFKRKMKIDLQVEGTMAKESEFERDQRKERAVGMTEFVNTDIDSFSGTLKRRFTDFVVNEIGPDGSQYHLTDDKAPQRPVKKAIDLNPAIAESIPSSIITEVVEQAEKEGVEIVASVSEAAEVAKNDVDKPTSEQPQVTASPIVEGDAARLASYITESCKDEVLAFNQQILAKPNAKAAVFGSLSSPPINDKSIRGLVHALVRRMFESRIETMSDELNRIKFFAAARAPTRGKGLPQNHRSDTTQRGQNNQLNGKLGWEELGGQHLHFSLYKENKDTMEVIGVICKILRIKNSDFGFAGTKDRRAVTVQRVSVFKQHAERLAGLNRQLRSARVGNFSYQKTRLELGDLSGNLFTITLRDCHFEHSGSFLDDAAELQLANNIVGTAVNALRVGGFINYFGLQRFGSFDISTDHIGKLILQGNFKGAVDALLSYSTDILAIANSAEPGDSKIGRDDLNRAQAIHKFRATGRANDALNILPRRFSAETAIIRHLGGKGRNDDYLGAILLIARNLRTMYVHAYQSKVWNMCASERFKRYGSQVTKGDLILVDHAAEKVATQDDVDENGEIVIHPKGDEVAVSQNDIFERARALSAEEAASGKYSIFDIVLPTPGFDIEYPDNDIGDYYKEFMESEEGGGLDPSKMRRNQKDFSLSGSYRKLLATIGDDFSFEVHRYKDEVEQFIETDWDKLKKGRPEKDNISGFDAPKTDLGPQNGHGGANGRNGRDNWKANNVQGNAGGANGSGQNSWRSGANSTGNPQGNVAFVSDDNKAKINAWKNLPSKLATEEKATAQEAASKPREKNTFVPTIKETWVQTSADNASDFTGKKVSTVIEVTATDADPMVVDKKDNEVNPPVGDKTDVISDNSTTDSSGGAALHLEHVGDVAATQVPTAASNTETKEEKSRIAVIVKFTLGPSQYATVALRELMRGVNNYQPEFNNGR